MVKFIKNTILFVSIFNFGALSLSLRYQTNTVKAKYNIKINKNFDLHNLIIY